MKTYKFNGEVFSFRAQRIDNKNIVSVVVNGTIAQKIDINPYNPTEVLTGEV